MKTIKNIAVIGASGSTGRQVVRTALEKGYHVTIVARNPEKFPPQQNVTVAKGDVTGADLASVLKNTDAVISCFGPANGRKPGKIMSEGVHSILKACEENGISRFVFMSGILQTSGKELAMADRLAINLIRKFYMEGYRDKTLAEEEILKSPVQSVIVRAVGLAELPAAGKYKAGEKLAVKPFKRLSYADCAACLVDAVENTDWTGKIINVGSASV